MAGTHQNVVVAAALGRELARDPVQPKNPIRFFTVPPESDDAASAGSTAKTSSASAKSSKAKAAKAKTSRRVAPDGAYEETSPGVYVSADGPVRVPVVTMRRRRRRAGQQGRQPASELFPDGPAPADDSGAAPNRSSAVDLFGFDQGRLPSRRIVIPGQVIPSNVLGARRPLRQIAPVRQPRAIAPAGIAPQTRIGGALPMGTSVRTAPPAGGDRFLRGDHPTRSTVYDAPSSRPRQPDIMVEPLHADERSDTSSYARRLEMLSAMQFEQGRHGQRLVPEYSDRAADPTRLF